MSVFSVYNVPLFDQKRVKQVYVIQG